MTRRAVPEAGAAVAVGSLVIQAVASFSLLLLMAHLLPPAAYTVFSLAVTTAQFVSVLGFEWIRLAGGRFFPGPDDGREAERLAALRLLLMGSVVAVVAGVFVLSGGAAGEWRVWGLVALISVLQGTSDFRQTMLRYQGHLLAFGGLQSLRALLLLTGAAGVALLAEEAEAALLGLVAAYGMQAAISHFAAPRLPRAPVRHATKHDMAAMARYGVPAAIASVLYLGTTLGWRWLVIGSLGVQSEEAAAFSLALDIFQKPFPLLGTMVGTIALPGLMRAYDRGTPEEQRVWLGGAASTLVTFSVVGASALVALLPAIASLVVPTDYRAFFLAASPAVILYFALLLNLQNTAALIPQVRKETLVSALLAGAQLVAGLAAVFIAVGLSSDPAVAALALGAVTGGLVVAGGFYARSELPSLDKRLLLLAALCGALMLASGPALSATTQVVVVVAAGCGFLALYARTARGWSRTEAEATS